MALQGALHRRLLSREALALAPRALVRRPGEAEPQGRAKLAVKSAALSPEAARTLTALPGGRLHPGPGRDETTFSAPLSSLRRAAESAPLGELLLATWRAATRPPQTPRILGVLNVTPDSFSDGGLFLEPEAALDHALQMAAEGADAIDVGGESTRPGSEPVPLEVELRRVLPVIERLAREIDLPLFVDTTKAAVAERALAAGALGVNDVSAGRADPRMLEVVATAGAKCVLMHMRGTPRDMQLSPTYGDPVAEILEHLRERALAAWEAGIEPARIVVDPGIGFGKALEHNLALIARAGEFRSLGLPLLFGVSRKSFIGHVTGAQDPLDWGGSRARVAPAERVGGTAAAVALSVAGGAEWLRVHDVGVMREAALVAAAVASTGADPSRRREATC